MFPSDFVATLKKKKKTQQDERKYLSDVLPLLSSATERLPTFGSDWLFLFTLEAC